MLIEVKPGMVLISLIEEPIGSAFEEEVDAGKAGSIDSLEGADGHLLNLGS
jgi:hypothetical protein